MIAEALFFSAVLFSVGAFGVLTRRNAILVFMCVELMLNAVNLAFVALSPYAGIDGQVIVFFVIAVAAAEAAVGLAIVVSLFRARNSADIDDLGLLRD